MKPGTRIRVRENPAHIWAGFAGREGIVFGQHIVSPAPEWCQVLLDRHRSLVDLHVDDLEVLEDELRLAA